MNSETDQFTLIGKITGFCGTLAKLLDNSVPSLYGRFGGQNLPYKEDIGLRSFLHVTRILQTPEASVIVH